MLSIRRQLSSPACTELEVVMMDWLAKMLDLPQEFMSGGKGGGVIQVNGSVFLWKGARFNRKGSGRAYSKRGAVLKRDREVFVFA